MWLVNSRHLSQLNLTTVQTALTKQNFVDAIKMLFKSRSCRGRLEVFIRCHNEVIMSPQCNGLLRNNGDFKKLPFCKFLLYFIYYWPLVCQANAINWLHSFYFPASQRALHIYLQHVMYRCRQLAESQWENFLITFENYPTRGFRQKKSKTQHTTHFRVPIKFESGLF